MRCTKGQDLKKEILQATGLKSKDISVRYDGSYHVKLKTVYPISIVEEIAKTKESYQRDEKTFEILCGGNTFVFVDYDYDLQFTDDIKNTILSLKDKISFGSYPISQQDKIYQYARLLINEFDTVTFTKRDCCKVLNIDYNIVLELCN